MTYRQAAVPAVAAALLLTALLWWAGGSAQALHLPGSTGLIARRASVGLERWLTPWSYDPPVPLRSSGGGVSGTGDGARYLTLYRTGMQIRFAAVFAVFGAGALLLIRRLPPVTGRVPATLLALWAWGPVAGTLAVAVSAPWLIASRGNAGFRFLPQLASAMSDGRQIVVATAPAAAAAAVLLARIIAKDSGPVPRAVVPVRSARLAATAGTLVTAVSLVLLSYQPVAARIQALSPGAGVLAEPGDLLRQWLLLGAWSGPAGAPIGDWLLHRAVDALLLAVVWWSLRLLPSLLTRATVCAMAAGAVCATVLGLLACQALRMAVDGADSYGGPASLTDSLGDHVPAALVFGVVAGMAAAATLRATGHRTEDGGAVAPGAQGKNA
ncbi:hypothetical protein ACFU6R_28770 [Streptomyces sp. NPDC057499]|uniref:hypothetical protein n=1 Tax=Streptomyces sp. NPDC057499 TaxID=3346150 RepID=UPI0036C35A34